MVKKCIYFQNTDVVGIGATDVRKADPRDSRVNRKEKYRCR